MLNSVRVNALGLCGGAGFIDGLNSRENQADGGGSGDVAGGPVGGCVGKGLKFSAIRQSGRRWNPADQLPTAITEQNIAGTGSLSG
jgi:hypothetical protein